MTLVGPSTGLPTGPTLNIGSGTVNARNSLFVSDLSDDCAPANALSGSDDHNISIQGDASCGLVAGGTNRIAMSSQILLGPLAYNGGPHGVLTHTISANTSGAQDFADPSDPDCDTTANPSVRDNRSADRKTGTACDAGAYEVGGIPDEGILEITGGPASPGTLTLDVAGVTIMVAISGGASNADAVAAVVAEINGNLALGALGVQAVALTGAGGEAVVSATGSFTFFNTGTTGLSSPQFAMIPLLPALGIAILLAASPLLVIVRSRRRRKDRR